MDKAAIRSLLPPLWEAAKEPLRLLVLALIPILLVYFEGLSAEWAAILVVLLRFADKILHEVGKARENSALTGGITRF